jgi:hypothetical protein
VNDRTQQPEKFGQDCAAAELHRDTGFLGEALADGFVGVGPRGFTLGEEQWLSRQEAGNLRYGFFGLGELEVPLRERGGHVPRDRPRDARFRAAARVLATGQPAI